MIPRRRYNLEPSFLRDAIADAPGALRKFEGALREFLGGGMTVRATSSGRAALAVLLDALEVPRGSTVMIPGYTLGAMGPFLESLGYRWTACDVAADRPVMTPETVAAAWPGNDSVRCVLPTHLFDIPADVPAIADIAHGRGAVVIEDCAHSIGSAFGGRMTGTMGDGALFSFDYLKPVNGFGGGAAVRPGQLPLPVLPDQSRAHVAAMFATGIAEDVMFAGPWLRVPTGLLAMPGLSKVVVALDSRIRRPSGQKFACHSLSPAQAAHGLKSLSSLPARLDRRRAAAARIALAVDLDASMWDRDAETRANAYFLVIMVPDATSLRRRLWLHGIDAGIGTEVADSLVTGPGPALPNARAWFKHAIQVPCHESLSDADIDSICRTLRECLDDNA